MTEAERREAGQPALLAVTLTRRLRDGKCHAERPV